jgi:hemolysin activation/secretion protein
MNDEYSARGSSRTFRFGLDRVLHRDADSKTSAGISLSNHRVDNYFEDYHLDASSYFLTNLGISLSHSRRLLGGSFTVRLEQRMGFPIFGAQKDTRLEYSTPRREYQKTLLLAYWYAPFALGKQTFAWCSSFSGQYSPHTLYGSERFYLGSFYTVSGFEGSPLGGDKGMLLRNELAWNTPPAFDWLARLLGPVQLYVAYDVGSIRRDSYDPYERGTLQGAAVGIRSHGDVSFDLTYARALSQPDFVETKHGILSCSVRYMY